MSTLLRTPDIHQQCLPGIGEICHDGQQQG